MDHDLVKIPGLESRYVPPEGIASVLEPVSKVFDNKIIGHSVENRPIHMIQMGSGPIKILLWSQMHGNETTTTRALLDLINLFIRGEERQAKWLKLLTLCAIPMLNPDGAKNYTRENANDSDLNRDAQTRSQPETKALFSVYKNFQPDFCFNLHDQRTRYAVGDSEVPTTLAFLAPSADKVKTITPARKLAMQLIAGISRAIQTKSVIGIARFDDAYNAKCVGDSFTTMGTPTILIEAGHYPDDYQRNITRKYIYNSLCFALELIANKELEQLDHSSYFDIPENRTSFADIVLNNTSSDSNTSIALNFEEQLIAGQIDFIPKPITESYAASYFGHKTYDLGDESDVKLLKSDSNLSSFIE